MTVYIENEYTGPDFEEMFSFDFQETAEAVVLKALDLEDCPYEAEVNILLTGSEEMQAIKRENRGIDRVTDVLSFPMNDFEEPGNFDHLEEDVPDAFDPDSGELLLGDIVLCIPKIREQAEAYGHSIRREYAFLIAHSVLHLVGYDHMTPDEERVMIEKQETVLSELGIKREKSEESI